LLGLRRLGGGSRVNSVLSAQFLVAAAKLSAALTLLAEVGGLLGLQRTTRERAVGSVEPTYESLTK